MMPLFGRPLRYILTDHHIAVPCDDLTTWHRWFDGAANRRVALTEVGPVTVSTVFLGLDHNFGDGEPILFETMTFSHGDGDEDGCWRCCTWAAAERQHAEVVALTEVRVAATDGILNWQKMPSKPNQQ